MWCDLPTGGRWIGLLSRETCLLLFPAFRHAWANLHVFLTPSAQEQRFQVRGQGSDTTLAAQALDTSTRKQVVVHCFVVRLELKCCFLSLEFV